MKDKWVVASFDVLGAVLEHKFKKAQTIIDTDDVFYNMSDVQDYVDFIKRSQLKFSKEFGIPEGSLETYYDLVNDFYNTFLNPSKGA